MLSRRGKRRQFGSTAEVSRAARMVVIARYVHRDLARDGFVRTDRRLDRPSSRRAGRRAVTAVSGVEILERGCIACTGGGGECEPVRARVCVAERSML